MTVKQFFGCARNDELYPKGTDYKDATKPEKVIVVTLNNHINDCICAYPAKDFEAIFADWNVYSYTVDYVGVLGAETQFVKMIVEPVRARYTYFLKGDKGWKLYRISPTSIKPFEVFSLSFEYSHLIAKDWANNIVKYDCGSNLVDLI